MQTKYYVSHSSRQVGPYTPDEIVDLVVTGALSPIDFLYDEIKSDWMALIDHPLLCEKLKALKPKAPPKIIEVKEVTPLVNTEVATAVRPDWFVLKGENKFGPFAYFDILKMLQQGAVFEFDFVWHEGLDGWKRLAELPDFAKNQIQALRQSEGPETRNVFSQRRHKRVLCHGEILVHDNKKVWTGHTVELSEGGAGVVMQNAMLLPGQDIHMHFKPAEGMPAFNAMCEIVSKEYVAELKSRETPIRYGLRFKSLNLETQKILKDLAQKKIAS